MTLYALRVFKGPSSVQEIIIFAPSGKINPDIGNFVKLILNTCTFLIVISVISGDPIGSIDFYNMMLTPGSTVVPTKMETEITSMNDIVTINGMTAINEMTSFRAANMTTSAPQVETTGVETTTSTSFPGPDTFVPVEGNSINNYYSAIYAPVLYILRHKNRNIANSSICLHINV